MSPHLARQNINYVATLILYTTSACHLCEQAKSLIYTVIDSSPVSLVEIDIAEDRELFQRYGMRIPVVQHEQTQREYSWPFDREQIKQLIDD